MAKYSNIKKPAFYIPFSDYLQSVGMVTYQENQLNDIHLLNPTKTHSIGLASGNDYTYNLFVNQNFKKDKAGIVTDLAFPDNLNLLYLHTGTDLNVSDKGDINLEELVGKQVAVINYLSNGKYKKQTWQRVGSIDDHDALSLEFSKSIKAGYPKDFIGYGENNAATAADVEATFNGNADDGLPF